MMVPEEDGDAAGSAEKEQWRETEQEQGRDAEQRKSAGGEEEEDGEEGAEERLPAWVASVRANGPVPMQHPDRCSGGWASPPPSCFIVRGPDYFTSKAKIPAPSCILQPLGFDWIKSSSKIAHILSHPNGRVRSSLPASSSPPPFVWAFNLQIPSKDNYSAVAYFVSLDPIPDGSLLHQFIHGDDAFKNSRLKLIANIVNGPWIVKAAVGEQAICILGRAVSCKYHQGENFIEVDVDIGASILANAVVHLAFGYIQTLTVDLAFLIEAQTEEELPEKLLGAFRFANLDPASATSIDIPIEEPVQTEEAAPSLPSRWWKSFSTYINGEEPVPADSSF